MYSIHWGILGLWGWLCTDSYSRCFRGNSVDDHPEMRTQHLEIATSKMGYPIFGVVGSRPYGVYNILLPYAYIGLI